MPVATVNKTKDPRGISPITHMPLFANFHNHTDFSNQRFRDSRNKVWPLAVASKKKGMAGIAYTDHGVLSGAVKVAKDMDAHPDFFNGKDGKGTFKPVIGEEIYLDDANIIEHAVRHNDKTKFFHFVLTAQDDLGLHALRIISSNSWGLRIENIKNDDYDVVKGKKIPRPHAFFFRGMRRIPTYKDWLQDLMLDPKFHFKGHLFAGTACLGSELSRCILSKDKPRAKRFIRYIEKTFGKDHCYFEMMPADNRHGQITVNHALWAISHGNYFDDDTGYGIPCVITTDSHYIDSRDRHAHSTFLKAENPDRDVKDFYAFAHTFTYKDLEHYFPANVLKEATTNSMKLLHRYAPIWHQNNESKMRKVAKEHPDHPPVRLHYISEIPESPAPKDIPRVNMTYYAHKYNIDWSKYPYFHLFNHPEQYRNPKTGKPLDTRTRRADRIYLARIFNGMNEHHLPFNYTYLREINWELMTVHQKTLTYHEPQSAYFLTVHFAVIDTCWHAGSLVGPGRGSCSEWITNFLLNISQVNSIRWHLWAPRFLAPQRNDPPDIDLDSESSKRPKIMDVSRQKYGSDRVMNFSVFDKQASKSTIYDAGRGWHIPLVKCQDIANALPADARGMGSLSLHDAFFGNKKNGIKPAKKFISAVGRYPGLKNDMLHMVNTINGVGEHASGVAFFNEPLTQRNAMMRTNKKPGIPITQFSAHDSAYLSNLKYDMLTLSALDRCHMAIHLLALAGKIQKVYVPIYKTINGKKVYVGRHYSLYKTYIKYFGPRALDFTSKGMYEMLFKGEITNAFEFSSIVGRSALKTMHATDFSALVAANALMRLTVDPDSPTHESHMMRKYWGREQPIDRYVRYRDNPGDWDKDMKRFGLNKHEMDIMHQFLNRHRGVCYSQEDLMKLDMRICYGIKDFLAMSPKDKKSYIAYNSANTLRKAVAKKNPKILEQARQSLYKMGKERGVRRQMLDYFWYNCAVPAKNYSFNLSHGVAYTIILIIEMNICYRFGPIFWQTACLSVNAGLYGSHFKNPDYDKLDRAMAGLRGKIINPDINKSHLGFYPYHDKILFGLYPINGLSADDAETIIKNRKAHGAYKSFKDFVMRTKLTKKTNITLIKSGAFDCFGTDRILLMAQYIEMAIPEKKRLTTTQIKKMEHIKNPKDQIPDKYSAQVKAYNFRKEITGRKNILTKDKQTNASIKQTYLKDYAAKVKPYAKSGQMSLLHDKTAKDNSAVGHTDAKGYYIPNTKAFNKWYQKFMKPLKAWLKTPKARQDEASLRRRKLWNKYCCPEDNTSVSKSLMLTWEMDALGCYIHGHELEATPIKYHYPIANFSLLPKKPKPIYKGHFKNKQGQVIHYKMYRNSWIYGTVIGKNANKGLVFLLTPHGLANVRVGKWRYPVYNKRISKKVNGKRQTVKDSWFKRGTKLLVVGHELDDNFIVNDSRTYVHIKGLTKTGEPRVLRCKVNECLFRIKGLGANATLVDAKEQTPKFLYYTQPRQAKNKLIPGPLDKIVLGYKPSTSPQQKKVADICIQLNDANRVNINNAKRSLRLSGMYGHQMTPEDYAKYGFKD